jgi:hypothetical protein
VGAASADGALAAAATIDAGAGATAEGGLTSAVAPGSDGKSSRRPCCSATALTTMPIIIASSAAPAKPRRVFGASARSARIHTREGCVFTRLAAGDRGSTRIRSAASGNTSLLLPFGGGGLRRTQPGNCSQVRRDDALRRWPRHQGQHCRHPRADPESRFHNYGPVVQTDEAAHQRKP